MNISEPFIRRPIAASLLTGAIALIGMVAVPLLPVAPLPQVDFPTIQVTAQLPGASPETMASSVAAPLERQFGQIAGVTQMLSTSTLGQTSISLQFDLDRNIDAAAQDVQAAITAAGRQLPATLSIPPTYRKTNPADPPILILAAYADTLPLTTVDEYADNVVAQQISQIPGVSLVVIGGEQKPAIRIQVDPAKLASAHLTLEDVRGVLANATSNAAKGALNGARQSFTIAANDQLLQAAGYDDVVLAYRNGAPVRVRDVGRAVDGPEDANVAAWENGRRSVILVVYKQPGANVISTVDKIKASLPHLALVIPPSIKIDTIMDRTLTIRASVDEVEVTLALTCALVVLVILLFLRNTAVTIIPSVVVPLSLLGAAAAMYLAGFSLNNLSLMALTISVGFVVDDAIVVVENIFRHVESGALRLDAALDGAREIGFTVVSISLSLVAVFIPLLLMGGIIGRLFREFALTVSLAIIVSLIVSLTLTPMLCSRFLRPVSQSHGMIYLGIERVFDAMLRSYGRGLDVVLRHQALTLGIFLMTAAASFALAWAIPKGFFPIQDTGVIFGLSEAAQDVSPEEMRQRQQALAAVIAADPDIEAFGSAIGGVGGQTPNTGRFFIALKPRDERRATAMEVIQRLRPQLAPVEGAALYLQPSQDITVGGRIARSQFQYTLQDLDLQELNAWGPRLLAKLKQLPELADVASDQQSSAPQLTITINRDQAARFGIQPQVIDDTLNDAFGQRQVVQYFTQMRAYNAILEVPPAMQGDPRTLRDIYVKAPTGQLVPLSTLVTVDSGKTGPLSVSHQGQFPAVTLSFNLAPGVSLGEAVNAVEAAVAGAGKPASLTGSFQGNAQAFQTSLASEPYLIAAALMVVYIILGVLYESYIHPLTILSTLPSAGVGALAALWLGGFDLSVIGIIAIILLIGIVKKNGIMLVDFAIVGERERGLSPHAAIREACLLRFRPILMTTMAAMLGGVPLMLAGGAGSELRQPLGYAMVGGLLVSQLLTLFTTPVVYLYLDRLQDWLSGKTRRAAATRAMTAR